METDFRVLVDVCEKIEATSKRKSMVEWVAEFLKQLSVSEVEPAISMMLGRVLPIYDQRTLDVDWTMLRNVIENSMKINWGVFTEAFNKTGDVGSAAKIVFEAGKTGRQTTLTEKPLTILEVRRHLEAVVEALGYGSRERKQRLIETLLGRASPSEAKYIIKIIIKEIRMGFHEGLMEQAVSKAFEIPLDAVQRANMLIGDIGMVAYIAKIQGKEGILKTQLQIFRPIKPMLAQTAEEVQEVLNGNEIAFEYKLDGARIQIHRSGCEVRVYSRRLTDVTESLPEIVDISRKIKAHEAILEGEVIAVGEKGSPLPFQHLMRRFLRVRDVNRMITQVPIKLYLFDLLYINGQGLIDHPYIERRKTLSKIAENVLLIKQIITNSSKEAERFLNEAIEKGHEGLVAKKLDSLYTPGFRGKYWFKIKKALEPLDLVIIAAEYGYGKRHKWLSDLVLACIDESRKNYVVVGKTFKGLTDREIQEMTNKLLDSKIEQRGRRVYVKPKIVVEVAFNEIQKSEKYESEIALRFARVLRIRWDKDPRDADTLEKVMKIYQAQFKRKAKYYP